MAIVTTELTDMRPRYLPREFMYGGFEVAAAIRGSHVSFGVFFAHGSQDISKHTEIGNHVRRPRELVLDARESRVDRVLKVCPRRNDLRRQEKDSARVLNLDRRRVGKSGHSHR